MLGVVGTENPSETMGVVEMSAESKLQGSPYQFLIAMRLFLAASLAARNAILTYANEAEHEVRQAAIDCGSASEYLLKSFLAERDLTLLAAAGDPLSMVILSDAKVDPRPALDQVRTVNTDQMMKLFLAIDNNLKIDTDYRKIQGVRNAAVHLAFVDSSKLRESLMSLVNLVDLTLARFGKSADEFWGVSLAEHVEKFRSDIHSEVDRKLSAKLAAARNRLGAEIGRYGQLQAEDRFSIAERAWSNGVGETDNSVITSEKCPACGYQGIESFFKYRDTAEAPTVLPNAYEPSVRDYWGRVYPVAEEFRCGVCELQLDESELAAAGLPRELEARDELLENYEPIDDGDSDWFYGR